MTTQRYDRLILDGEEMALSSCPPIPSWHPRILQREPDEVSFATDCHRGYVGSWEIRGNRLYLLKVEGIYLLQGAEPIPADWVSQGLTVPQGDLLHRSFGFDSIYERELVIRVEKGTVVETKLIDNRFHDGLCSLYVIKLRQSEDQLKAESSEVAARGKQLATLVFPSIDLDGANQAFLPVGDSLYEIRVKNGVTVRVHGYNNEEPDFIDQCTQKGVEVERVGRIHRRESDGPHSDAQAYRVWYRSALARNVLNADAYDEFWLYERRPVDQQALRHYKELGERLFLGIGWDSQLLAHLRLENELIQVEATDGALLLRVDRTARPEDMTDSEVIRRIAAQCDWEQADVHSIAACSTVIPMHASSEPAAYEAWYRSAIRDFE